MNKHLKRFSSQYSLIVVIFLFVAWFFIYKTSYIPEDSTISAVSVSGTVLSVDLAITPEEKELGLGGRDSLAVDQGMLFVFDKSARYYFWMKDMKFPIDMIWIDEDMKVSHIKHNATPRDNLTAFGPDTPSRYVLEVVSGWSTTHDLKIGDEVEFIH